jgi:hypothetical protein
MVKVGRKSQHRQVFRQPTLGPMLENKKKNDKRRAISFERIKTLVPAAPFAPISLFFIFFLLLAASTFLSASMEGD